MIVKSILDDDQYKLSMQQGALELFPEAEAVYKFKNRGEQIFPNDFEDKILNEIENMSTLKLSKDEYSWVKHKNPFFKPWYLEYLKNYRYDPRQIKLSRDDNNRLNIDISGKWYSSIKWEVSLMAVISEIFFKEVDTGWNYDLPEGEVISKATNKAINLFLNKCYYADFGTRRRRSYMNQDMVIKDFVEYSKNQKTNYFVGTSNLHFAMKYDLKPIGTCAHEWTQAMQALESLNHCNYYALQNWVKVYSADLGIALADTITSDMFFKNFNRRLSMLYKGIRHDSGDPFVFTDKAIAHYKKLEIDPESKVIIFSDGLNVDKTIEIAKYCKNKIKCSFGIGTHFTSDFNNSPALNMVIKLWSINNFPVVKLSDVRGKENGDPKAIENMKWIVKNQLGL